LLPEVPSGFQIIFSLELDLHTGVVAYSLNGGCELLIKLSCSSYGKSFERPEKFIGFLSNLSDIDFQI